VPIFKLFYDYPSSHSLYITANNVTNTTHWQLGAIIDNQTANCRDCVIAEFGMEVFTNESSDGGGEASKRRMVFTQTKLTVDPRINKVTTWTQPADLPVIPMEGCIETLGFRAKFAIASFSTERPSSTTWFGCRRFQTRTTIPIEFTFRSSSSSRRSTTKHRCQARWWRCYRREKSI
jgi:hypothetical protein